MLALLRIRNFAIIEEAELEFGAGLNVLSGETGAGKTIILTALGLLLGSRASPDMIRAGEKEAIVEALFEIEGEVPGLDPAQTGKRELLVRRVIAEGGRSRVTIGGELSTVQSLARIGAALVQVYGQHEQQSLLRTESHREILDRYARLDGELAAYRAAFEHARELESNLGELGRRERERADLLEFARFRLTELERAGISLGEDQALAAERIVLANASRLAAAAAEVEASLYGAEGAAVDAVAAAETRLVEAVALDAKLRARKSRRSRPLAVRIRRPNRSRSGAAGRNRQSSPGTHAAKAQIRRYDRHCDRDARPCPRRDRGTRKRSRIKSRRRASTGQCTGGFGCPRKAAQRTANGGRRRAQAQDGNGAQVAWNALTRIRAAPHIARRRRNRILASGRAARRGRL
ncbi:MAG: AAA family ATPase [Candidatus Binataceae bacterium]